MGEAIVAASSEQLFVVEPARAPRELVTMSNNDVRRTIDGLVHLFSSPRGANTRLGMGLDLAVSSSHIVWSSAGDTTAPSTIHHLPREGGSSSHFLAMPRTEHVRHLAVEGDTLYFEHNRQDPREGRILESSIRALDLKTRAVSMIASLDALTLSAMGVRGGVLYAIFGAIGTDSGKQGLFRIESASGRLELIDRRIGPTQALAMDDDHLYVASTRGLERLPL